MRQYFYVPGDDEDFLNRADQRVTILDYDEVSMTHRVVFNDGFRAVVRAKHLTFREV